VGEDKMAATVNLEERVTVDLLVIGPNGEEQTMTHEVSVRAAKRNSDIIALARGARVLNCGLVFSDKDPLELARPNVYARHPQTGEQYAFAVTGKGVRLSYQAPALNPVQAGADNVAGQN